MVSVSPDVDREGWTRRSRWTSARAKPAPPETPASRWALQESRLRTSSPSAVAGLRSRFAIGWADTRRRRRTAIPTRPFQQRRGGHRQRLLRHASDSQMGLQVAADRADSKPIGDSRNPSKQDYGQDCSVKATDQQRRGRASQLARNGGVSGFGQKSSRRMKAGWIGRASRLRSSTPGTELLRHRKRWPASDHRSGRQWVDLPASS
jgi:hypothetical protein